MASASSTAGPLYPVNGFDPEALRGATLVIPAVSLGNVPQLAADLLVASLGLTRVGFLGLGDTVAPFAGQDDDQIVTGGMELYGGKDSVYVLLQRAPTLKKEEHVQLVSSLTTKYGVGLTLVLASLDAANQDDAQLLTPHQAVLPPRGAGDNASLKRLAQIPPLRLTLEAGSAPSAGSSSYPPFLPGAGLTRRLLGALSDVPSGALAAWVVEGDNRGDAHALASVTLGVLGIDVAKLVEPASWAGLFGPEEWSGGTGLNAEIYG